MRAVLYLRLEDDERRAVEHLAAATSAAEGKLVSMTDVMRQLIRDAAGRKTPVRIRRPSVRMRAS
jgi:hypothetical protein